MWRRTETIRPPAKAGSRRCARSAPHPPVRGQEIRSGWQAFFTGRNIIIDNVAHKAGSCLLEIPDLEHMQEKDNCYSLRMPDDERKMFLASGARLGLADCQKKYGDKGSFIADPQFQGMGTAGKAAEAAAGSSSFPPDHLIGKKDLDFPDVFATNPKLVERGIGLQPEAFKDFHFNMNKLQKVQESK